VPVIRPVGALSSARVPLHGEMDVAVRWSVALRQVAEQALRPVRASSRPAFARVRASVVRSN